MERTKREVTRLIARVLFDDNLIIESYPAELVLQNCLPTTEKKLLCPKLLIQSINSDYLGCTESLHPLPIERAGIEQIAVCQRFTSILFYNAKTTAREFL